MAKMTPQEERADTIPLDRQQRGFVLVVGLLLLVVLSLLGVSAIQGTTMEERMAGNMQDRMFALQAAEAALREGENRLVSNASLSFKADGPDYSVNPTPGEPRWKSIYGAGQGAPQGSKVHNYRKNASYFIEKMPAMILPGNSLGPKAGPSIDVYRITAEGEGRSGGTAVVLQSVVIQ